MSISGPLSHFARDAQSFTTFVQSGCELGLNELSKLASLIAILCARAYSLPEITGEGSETLPELDKSSQERLAKELAARLPQDLYVTIDPLEVYSDVAPTVGQLSDDLADIWVEVEVGLRSWRQGGHQAQSLAGWHWRFTFHSHWGFHAVNALAVLNALIRRTRNS